MFLQRFLLALAAGFGLLQAGCFAQSNEIGGEAIDDIGVGEFAVDDDDETDPTNTTQNGLVTSEFHAQKLTLAQAFSQPLYDNGGVPNAFVQALLAPGNIAGQHVFKYAAKCMVPDGTEIVANQKVYSGSGLLNLATQWPIAGLPGQAASDPFACMAVHLNPYGVEVPIKVGGLPIRGVEADPVAPPDTYTFKEALWATEISGSILTIHVWPLDDLYAQCSIATNNAMYTRVCGTPNGSCGLVIHPSAAAECTGSAPDVYSSCIVNGAAMNVIQTWLDPIYVPTLYGSCVPGR